jgi:hypothetical protein
VFPESADAAAVCPDIFMPVCAVKHGVRQTYPNSCDARPARARILHAGACVAPSGNICFDLFMPVCAINPHTAQAADLRPTSARPKSPMRPWSAKAPATKG